MTSPQISSGARLRFAPSPTGALHLGSAMVAIANAMIARNSDGALILRIDDTDSVRSREHDVQELITLLHWLEIGWDEGPFRQSERAAEYAAALEKLAADGGAYPCFCGDARLAEMREEQQRKGEPRRYDGRCRNLSAKEVESQLALHAPHVLRLRLPEDRGVVIDDLIKGRIEIPANAFGDPVLRRADGSAGYLLATVVDDIMMKISHIVRGEDHLSNSAVQTLLFEALGEQAPIFAHLPLLRDVSGKKLSKRDPMGTLNELFDEGFLPKTIRRYLAEVLGQGDQDPFATNNEFLLDRVSSGAPKVDRARLESLGREDMAELPLADLLHGTGIEPDPKVEPLVRELAESCPALLPLRGEVQVVFDGPGPGDLSVLVGMFAETPEALAEMDTALDCGVVELRNAIEDQIDITDSSDAWAKLVVKQIRKRGEAKSLKTRQILQPIRLALTGHAHGVAIDLLLVSLGARESLRRLHQARIIVEELSAGGGAEILG